MTGHGLFWIASYPKSGNTWIRCLVASLERGGAAPDINALHRQCPWSARRGWLEEVTQVPTSDLTPAELSALRVAAHRAVAAGDRMARLAAPEVRCIKVHDRYDPRRYPASTTAGAICIVRDPRDIAPSWADQMNIPLDVAITQLAQDDLALARTKVRLAPMTEERLGSWSDHVASWLDRYDGPRLFIRYEDLSARPIEEVTRLSRFLGLSHNRGTVATAVENCRLEMMRAAERRHGFVERQAHQDRFFRNGRAGGWRGQLSTDQAKRIVADHRAMMIRLGYEPIDG